MNKGSAGAETEFLTIRDKDIKPCSGCEACKATGDCSIKDDMQEIYEKMLDADGIIFATPVYFWSVCGQAKILLDRTYALRFPYLRMADKVGGAIAVAGRTGALNALDVFQRYFWSSHMISADIVVGLAMDKGSIVKDERGMKSAWEMGRQVVLLIQAKFRYPKEYNIPLYTYVDEKYKVHRYPRA